MRAAPSCVGRSMLQTTRQSVYTRPPFAAASAFRSQASVPAGLAFLAGCFTMAQRKSVKKAVPKSAASSAGKTSRGLTAEERAALKETIEERSGKGEGEEAVLAKIAAMQGSDRAIATRLHAIIKANAPSLSSKTWYGMPAYEKDGKVVCFFRDAGKFKERYATLGFNDSAKLDEGNMWPIAFALKELTAAEEGRISALVKKAVS